MPFNRCAADCHLNCRAKCREGLPRESLVCRICKQFALYTLPCYTQTAAVVATLFTTRALPPDLYKCGGRGASKSAAETAAMVAPIQHYAYTVNHIQTLLFLRSVQPSAPTPPQYHTHTFTASSLPHLRRVRLLPNWALRNFSNSPRQSSPFNFPAAAAIISTISFAPRW